MDFPFDELDSTVVPILGETVIVLDHSIGINTVLAINLTTPIGCVGLSANIWCQLSAMETKFTLLPERRTMEIRAALHSSLSRSVFVMWRLRRAETLERTPDCHVTLCKHAQLACCVLIQRLAFNRGHQRCGFRWLMMWYGLSQLGSCSLGSIEIELRLYAESQLISEAWWSWSKGHCEGIEAFKREISLDYATFNEILQKMFSFWGYFYLVYFSPTFSTKWGWWLRVNPVLYLL